MMDKKFQNLNSKKKKVPQETFSIFVSGKRLSRVQHLIDNDDKSLLCILGVDGLYNEGGRDLGNFLLFDFFKIRRQELEKSGIDEELVDDIIILIRRSGVNIYCNPFNYVYLLPYVAHWPGVQFHCMSEKQYDAEAGEEFKMQNFVSMMQGVKSVIVPCNIDDALFDFMTIEKWPIIQAFALEEYGGGGFFTLKHKVTGMYSDLHNLYNQLDIVNLEYVLTKQLPLFDKQWSMALSTVYSQGCDHGSKLTPHTIAEPLSSYFNHGLVGMADDEISMLRRPFVLLGSQTNKRSFLEAQSTGSNKAVSLIDTNGPNNNPTHMICCGVSPRSPLFCVRSYFFNQSSDIRPEHSLSDATNPDQDNIRILEIVYKHCITAVYDAMQHYVKLTNIEKVSRLVHSELLQNCQTLPDYVVKHMANSKNILFEVTAYDMKHRSVPINFEHLCDYVMTFTLCVYDVPNSSHASMGSICFSESVLFSKLDINTKDIPDSFPSCDTMVLTSCIPHSVSWPLFGPCSELYTALHGSGKSDFTEFGNVLTTGNTCMLAIPHKQTQMYKDGIISFYTHGLVYTNHYVGIVTIPEDQISNIAFYDGDSNDAVVFVIIHYKESMKPYLNGILITDDCSIVLAFEPKTKAYKALINEVLPIWKLTSRAAPLKVLSELTEKYTEMHKVIQCRSEASYVMLHPLVKDCIQYLPKIHSFLNHFGVSSCATKPLSQSEVNALLPNQQVKVVDEQDKLVFTIIGGIPGSYKDNLAQGLMKMAKDDNRWVIVKAMSSSYSFDVVEFQANLSAVVRAWIKKRANSHSNKAMRAIVVAPGYTTPYEVITAIVDHPDNSVKSSVQIGAVTVCIDPLNAFMENRHVLPGVLSQCQYGYVNNVMFTRVEKNDNLVNIQNLIRAVNPHTAFLLAEKASSVRHQDMGMILSENAFNGDELTKARQMFMCISNQSLLPSPHIVEETVHFYQPLENKLLHNFLNLRKQYSGYPFIGNIYHIRGKTAFSDGRVLEIRYSVLNDVLSLTSPDTKATNIQKSYSYMLVFSGCGLNVDELKKWLKTASKQRPANKSLITAKDISREMQVRFKKDCHKQPLPEGWFYNGSQYVCFSGERSSDHPLLEEFIERYLVERNKEIEHYNAQINQQHYPDIFQRN